MEINMDQNVNGSNGLVSLMDLWTLFVSKLKLLVIVGLLVAIASGVLGAVLSLYGNRYEAEVKFYLSPSDTSDTLLYNMHSFLGGRPFLSRRSLSAKISDCIL